MIKEVLVVFKTHLDIGFTDYSKNVIDKYLNNYIPSAIETGYKLKDTDTPFIWTVGSWLVNEGLKRDKDGKLEQAIKDGIISWHGLPFTSHTELMNTTLFEYGLSISKNLDKRFGTHTIGSKMTDVPGHTIGMIPYMAKYGIKFMHIGVNEATPMPDVPPVFKWKCDDDEIIVMYETGYGENAEFDDFAICFGHTHDNQGAQSVDGIKALYEKLRKKYPDATIKAATLNDVAERMLLLKDLPVVDKEIGDTWIHGAGTDPKKLGMYRELLRYIEENGINGADLSDNLLLVPEHTWGMDLKVYYPNKRNWFQSDFEKTEGTEERVKFEKSWEEQRDYVRGAEKALGVSADYQLKEPSLDGFEEKKVTDADFEISWQLFDVEDYNRYIDKYITFSIMNIDWARWDYLKLGLPVYDGGIYTANITAYYEKGKKRLYKLEFEKSIAVNYGLPVIWAEEEDGYLELKFLGKKANRLPQAFWLKFKGQKESWTVSKMGRWIKPETVLGSPLIMATDNGISNGDVTIRPLDSALVAPFGRRLLDFELNPKGEDMYFNLYNNIWNTNFPMWYSDDTRYRFCMKKCKK